MKKTLLGLIIALTCLFGNSERAQAQITGVNVDSSYIYSQMTCIIPADAYLSIAGNIVGTPPPNDSITIYVNWGDGDDTTFKVANGGGWFFGNLMHTYTVAGIFSAMVVATTSNNLSDTLIANALSISNTCAPMQGRLYIDANNDCTYNTGETVVPNRLVHFFNVGTTQSYYAITDLNGEYNYGVPPGNYTISLGSLPGALTPSCPASGTVSQTVVFGNSYTNDFAFSCNASAPIDLAVYAYAGNWRHGFSRPLYLSVSSTNACTNSAGTLTVTLPADLSYTGTWVGNPAPTVAGSTLTWSIPNLSSLSNWSSYVMIYCSTAATLGDTLCINATITPAVPDANAANNSVVMCAEVNNSYDPNDKNVTPKGIGPAGNIINGTDLTYLINFQNTGNDVAYTVTITDAIDEDLDISTLKVIKSSHAMKSFITADDMITFRFDNINLPDSGANEPASHGHVIYTISPKANLPLGTTIHNTARIYFDYNDAIVTNTTLNTIAAPQNIQHLASGTLEASVYPNPASGNIYVDVKGNGLFQAELYDMLGRNVQRVNGLGGKAIVSVKEIAAGTYFLRLTNAQNEVLVTKVTVQH